MTSLSLVLGITSSDAFFLELVRGGEASHLEGKDGLRLCASKLEVRSLDVNLTLAGNFEIGIHYVVDEAADEAAVDPGVVLGVDRVRSTDNVATYAALLLGVLGLAFDALPLDDLYSGPLDDLDLDLRLPLSIGMPAWKCEHDRHESDSESETASSESELQCEGYCSECETWDNRFLDSETLDHV